MASMRAKRRRTRAPWLAAALGVAAALVAGCSKVERSAPVDGRLHGGTGPTTSAPSQGSTSSVPGGTAGPGPSAPSTSSPPSSQGSVPSTQPGPPGTTAPTSSVPAAPPPSASPGGGFQGGREAVQSGLPGTNHLAVLSAVRIGEHDGFDRVVFEFRPGDELPGYRVEYQTAPLRADPSGAPIAVDGDRVIVVRMQSASRVDLTRTPVVPVYPGPDRIAGASGSVAEVVLVGDFEATLTWAIGVRDFPRFSVATLGGPPRLVVDVEVSGRG